MGSLCEQYKKALEIITKEEGELKDDTYLDKLLDCSKESLSSTQQLEDWQILPFVRNSLSEDSPDSLKVFAIRLVSVILSKLPDQVLPLLELVPQTIYRPDQEPPVLFAVCDFLCHVFETWHVPNVGIWETFLRPIMEENVGKSFHLTKVIENLTVSLILVLGRSSNAEVSKDNFAEKIDDIMDDLWTPTDEITKFLCQVKPLLKIFQEVRVNKTLLKIENAQNLRRNLMGSIKSGTLMKNFSYSEMKSILELLVYLVEDVSPVDAMSELLETIVKSGNYSDSTVKAAIYVSLKHNKRFKNLGTFFLNNLHQEEMGDECVPFCIFTISVLNSLEIFKCDSICAEVLQAFSKCQFDEDGKDLTDGRDVKLFRNFTVFFKNSLECKASVSSDILELQKPMIRILKRYMGVSDVLKSDILVFLTTVLNVMEECGNMSETIQIILVQASSVSWDVRDSALVCISSILSNPSLDKELNHCDLKKIKNVVEVAKKDCNSFIRAAASRTLAVFIENCDIGHLDQTQLINDFKSCLAADTEAISRREAVKLNQTFHHKLLKIGGENENIKAVENLMIKALFDFDWEVKVNVVNFWKSAMHLIIKQSGGSDLLERLSEHGCLTAIVIAVDDYEHLVASKARELVDITKQLTNIEGKNTKYRRVEYPVIANKHKANVVEEEDSFSEIDDVIDDIVNRKNEDLMKDFMKENPSKDLVKENIKGRNCGVSKSTVRHITPELYVSFLSDFDCDDDKDSPCRLTSVLGDIMEAARGTGLVEDIDCY